MEAIQRYKIIVEKYDYEDFLNKGYSKLNSAMFDVLANNNSSMAIVLIAFAASAMTLCLIFVLRRRKHR